MRRSFFNKTGRVYEPNTFIGGVGADYITSEADLISLSDLTASDIEAFNIDANSNVSFFTKKEFSWLKGGDPFRNIASFTYYVAYDYILYPGPYITFSGDVNLTHLYMDLGANLFDHISYVWGSGLIGLKHIKIDINTEVNKREFLKDAQSLKKLDMRSTVDNVDPFRKNSNTLYNMISCERINLESCVNMNFSRTLFSPRFYNLKTGCKIYYNPALGVMDRNAFLPFNLSGYLSVGQYFSVNGLTYTAVNGTPTADGEFDVSGNVNSIRTNIMNAVNNDTRTGNIGKVTVERIASWDLSHAFVSSVVGVSGNTITANTGAITGMMLPNGNTFYGGHDVIPPFIYARDTEGAILIEKTNTTAPNAPTGLSYSNLTSNSVDLNFTEPTPNANGNDGYEVWIEDNTVYRKLFEYDEISASGDTVDLTEIVNDANSTGISGIKIKIRTIDGQYNFSPFSNEITLP